MPVVSPVSAGQHSAATMSVHTFLHGMTLSSLASWSTLPIRLKPQKRILMPPSSRRERLTLPHNSPETATRRLILGSSNYLRTPYPQCHTSPRYQVLSPTPSSPIVNPRTACFHPHCLLWCPQHCLPQSYRHK